MSEIPFGVGRCLYAGILNSIINLEYALDSKITEWNSYHDEMLTDIKEAMDWYKDNCIVSYSSLVEKLEVLEDKIKEVDVK